MFERRVLKDRAKAAFKLNYWRCVLVALIITLVAGGTGLSGPSTVRQTVETRKQLDRINELYNYDNDFGDVLDIDDFEGLEDIEDLDDLEDYYNLSPPSGGRGLSSGLLAGLVGLAFVIFLGTFILIIILQVFLLSPLHVGTRKYFLNNSYEAADVGLVGHAFQTNYKNIVKVCFFRDLYIFLWMLLLFVPGIIKAYEYRMVNYLLAENPDMDTKEALETSKNMMYGNKWDSFVLDLSFLGWEMLAVFFTLGLLGIFYVDPYMAATDAELYKVLSGKTYGFDEYSMGEGAFKEPTQNLEMYNPNLHSPSEAPQRNDEDVYITFEMTDDNSTHD